MLLAYIHQLDIEKLKTSRSLFSQVLGQNHEFLATSESFCVFHGFGHPKPYIPRIHIEKSKTTKLTFLA